MLNKAVCKRCVGEVCWDYFAERNWEDDDEVMCPADISDKWASILKVVPEWCPHEFEHLVAAGMSNVE
jgi:hypothetical protein